MAVTRSDVADKYILGDASRELDRLIKQGRFLGELTEHFLRAAGLEAGMHVLDVGCGAGEVTFIAARIVGPTGKVTAIEMSADSIALAEKRARDANVTNVTFTQADARSFVLPEPADAAIGRLVLMYFPDAGDVVRHLLKSVKPGGIVTFQEFDLEAAKCEPRSPLFELSLERLRETFRRAGASVNMGMRLGRVFEDAGLPTPRMRQAARVERGAESEAYHQVAEVVRTLLPAMERTGVATRSDVDIDTLESRLREEGVSLRATQVAPPLIAAWTRKPQ